MCGIAGVIGRTEREVAAALRPMNGCMTHRGPDDSGQEFAEVNGAWVGFGQRRLSIIDLSPAGHQPMVNPATGDMLIYNGEMYSFKRLRARLEQRGVRFRGHSDTEVVLHALREFGPESMAEMEGMYAFAFLDRVQQRVILARDPMGIKPLYTARVPEGRGGGLIFASEVRSILAAGLLDVAPDRQALAGLLAHGSVPEPLTFFQGIEMFPAGAYQVHKLQPGPAVIRSEPPSRHWWYPALDPAATEPDAVAAVRSTLDDAVRDHLVSDVPVGVFLSSGVDSTVVASLAARHSPHMRCFTVGFADAPDMSEAPLARETARLLGLDFHDIQITGETALVAMGRWLRSMDQPSMDGLNTYVVSQAVREQGIVVALSGLGGDELFGGYSSFHDVPRIARALTRIGWMPSQLRAWLMSSSGFGRPGQVREKLSDMGRAGADLLRLYVLRRRLMSDRRLAALGLDAARVGLDRSYMPRAAIDEARQAMVPDGVATVSRYESMFYMRNTLLRDSDTNGMAHSLEIRVPMLDKRMLELAHRLPGHVRLPEGRANKHLLRAAFGEFLRPELAQQTKRGFTLPVKRWMAGPLRPFCEEAVRTVRESGLVEGREVDAIWRGFLTQPEMQVWSSALMIVVLGAYLGQLRERGLARPA